VDVIEQWMVEYNTLIVSCHSSAPISGSCTHWLMRVCCPSAVWSHHPHQEHTKERELARLKYDHYSTKIRFSPLLCSWASVDVI